MCPDVIKGNLFVSERAIPVLYHAINNFVLGTGELHFFVWVVHADDAFSLTPGGATFNTRDIGCILCGPVIIELVTMYFAPLPLGITPF